MTQSAAIELMDGFATRTGLNFNSEPRRYLWTDAFAVINYLELHRQTKDELYAKLARRLVDQVHRVLGRHRADDPRSGWLSGLPEDAGAAHPATGGLRIGKPLPERSPEDPPDERLEWDRDGQYFHYLTKWMDALSRASSLQHESHYHRWAAELAHSTFPRFLQVSRSGAPVGLAWKMSIDLSRPQVSGMSPHDILDGYVTFKWLDAGGGSEPSLRDDTDILGRLVAGQHWETSDPLGLGGLLLDAFKLTLIPGRSESDERLIGRVLGGVTRGLDRFVRQDALAQPAARRLGFRELGLAIGLQTANPIASEAEKSPALADKTGEEIAALQSRVSVETQVIEFWLEHRNRRERSWQDHQDINDVMLATALLKAQIGTAKL